MRILAIETATEACSVAVLDGQRLIERYAVTPRGHAQQVLPWAEQVLAEAGLRKQALQAIAVGQGPGGFTGVRLGLSIAQGIALGLGVPLIGVSTLAALAMQAVTQASADAAENSENSYVLAALDARMDEVYYGYFQIRNGLPQPLLEQAVCAPDALPAPASIVPAGARCYGVGTGFAAQNGLLHQRFASQLHAMDAAALPRASAVLHLAMAAYQAGQAQQPEAVEPAYLRNQVALTLQQQQDLRAQKQARQREPEA